MNSFSVMNAKIFDGRRSIPARTIRVEDGHIAEVGSLGMRESDAGVIDARGGTILPGLIDAHVHLLPGSLRQAATFGVTMLIDQFSKPDLVASEATFRAQPGYADFRTSSIGATAPGGHPTMAYSPFPYLEGPSGADQFVAERVSEGATHIKVLYEDGSTSPHATPTLNLATIRSLVRAAHEANLIVVAHATTSKAAIDVVRCGVDVLAHAPFDEIAPVQLSEIARSGVKVITTMSIADGFPGADRKLPILGQPELARRLGAAWTKVIEQQSQRWLPDPLPDFSIIAVNVRNLRAVGVSLLAGTDAPNPGIIHGASMHRELQHLVWAGLTPTEALTAATGSTAEAFNLHDRGTIAVGQRADLLFVTGDPTVQITDTQNIRHAWVRGRPVDLDGYVSSDDEASGIASLHATTAKIMTAIIKLWPEFPASGTRHTPSTE
jgi:imidazolonepropionase-like amidohydrolase